MIIVQTNEERHYEELLKFFGGVENLEGFIEGTKRPQEGLIFQWPETDIYECLYNCIEQVKSKKKYEFTKDEFLEWWEKALKMAREQKAKERDDRKANDDFFQGVLSRFRQGKIDRAEAIGEFYQECKGDTCPDPNYFLYQRHDYTRENEYKEWLNEEPDPVIIPETNKTQQGTPEPPVAVENTQGAEQSEFMIILKATKSTAFNAMKKALEKKYVFYENGIFDFRCKKGSVGQFFWKADYIGTKERDVISQYITINGDPTTSNAIENAYRNPEPKDWDKMEADIFTSK